MKKLYLAILSFFIMNTVMLFATGSVVVEDVVNMTSISGSTITNSSVGMKIKASNGTIRVRNNTNVNNIRNSTISNSAIGIVGEGGDNVEISNNTNLTDISNSNINGVNIGIGNNISDEDEINSIENDLLE